MKQFIIFFSDNTIIDFVLGLGTFFKVTMNRNLNYVVIKQGRGTQGARGRGSPGPLRIEDL